MQRRQKNEQHVVLLHLGDHDPSGKGMSRDIVERLNTFEVFELEFHRLALNMNQIEQYAPPPNPTKLTDSRATGYIQQYGNECWELDALEPKVISALIETHVKRYRDECTYSAVLKRQEVEKSLLDSVAQNWSAVAGNWNKILREFGST